MPDKAPVHSKLLTQSAKATLTPLGLFQKGRSRIWLADNGWWLGHVEFQPSGWSKGSYLNVGCMWLWIVKDYYSFDLGYRVEKFQPFRNETDFTRVADHLAHVAAEKVLEYKRSFPNITALSDYYDEHPPSADLWDGFHAALAHGLCGRVDQAAPILMSIAANDSSYDWERAARADAEQLLRSVHEPSLFREVVTKRIEAARALLKLPKLDVIRFD